MCLDEATLFTILLIPNSIKRYCWDLCVREVFFYQIIGTSLSFLTLSPHIINLEVLVRIDFPQKVAVCKCWRQHFFPSTPSALSGLFFCSTFLLLRSFAPSSLPRQVGYDSCAEITELLRSEQPGVAVIAYHVPAHLGWSAK